MLAQLTPDQLIERFSIFDEWEQRYEYLIELGKQLPALPAAKRDETHRVRGCVSNVWIFSQLDSQKKLTFLGDSDAFIVKGLLAIVIELCDHQTPEAILQLDIPQIFQAIGLAQHLTPSRSNGLYSMVNHVRRLAQACLAATQ